MPKIDQVLAAHIAFLFDKAEGSTPDDGGGVTNNNDPSLISDSPFATVRLISKKALDINHHVHEMEIHGEHLYLRTQKVMPGAVPINDPIALQDTKDRIYDTIFSHRVNVDSLETQAIPTTNEDNISSLLKRSICIDENAHYFITAIPSTDQAKIRDVRIVKENVETGSTIMRSDPLRSLGQETHTQPAFFNYNITTNGGDIVFSSLKMIGSSQADGRVEIYTKSLTKKFEFNTSNRNGFQFQYNDDDVTIGRFIYGREKFFYRNSDLFREGTLQNPIGISTGEFEQPSFIARNQERDIMVFSHPPGPSDSVRLIGINKDYFDEIPSQWHKNPFKEMDTHMSNTLGASSAFWDASKWVGENGFCQLFIDTIDRTYRHKSKPSKHTVIHFPSSPHGNNRLYSIGDAIIGIIQKVSSTEYKNTPNKITGRVYQSSIPVFLLKNGMTLDVFDSEKLFPQEITSNSNYQGNPSQKRNVSRAFGTHVVDKNGNLYYYNACDRTLYKFKITAKKIK